MWARCGDRPQAGAVIAGNNDVSHLLSHGMLLQAPAGAYRSTSWAEPGAAGPEDLPVLPADAEGQLGKAVGGQQPWRSQVPTLCFSACSCVISDEGQACLCRTGCCPAQGH